MVNKIDSFSGKYEFLSNFYECPFGISFEGIIYPTVEHAFQAAKTLDFDIRLTIAALVTPGLAKRAGRKVSLRSDWEQVKIDVMQRLCVLKFLGDTGLRKKLYDTGDAILIEGNTWGDRFWGVCQGTGENHLGKILMDIRKIARNLEEAKNVRF